MCEYIIGHGVDTGGFTKDLWISKVSDPFIRLNFHNLQLLSIPNSNPTISGMAYWWKYCND